jgi:uncharacterized Zn finger protein (UPF0148 family)
MAGKSGKCPKCQQPIKIPQPAPNATKTPQAAPGAKPKATQQPPAANNSLDGLFEAAGLTQRKGNFCPSCDAPVQAGAVMCVQCGLQFAEGTVLESHKVETKRQFGNKRLNEAADMMAREADTEKRLLGAGTPWWFMFAGLAGIVVFIGGAVIKMDASTSGQISSNAMMARIQKAAMLTVLIASAGSAAGLVASFSYIAIVVNSFYESLKQGLLCLFAPLYIVFYMFSRIISRRLLSTVILFWITLTLAIVCLVYALPKI